MQPRNHVANAPVAGAAFGADVEIVPQDGIYGDEHENHVALLRQLPELACR
jgi:hypothetical protein